MHVHLTITSKSTYRWALENFNKGQIPVQTIRDLTTITTAGAAAAMSFISIFVGLSKSGFASNELTGCPGSNPDCPKTEEYLRSTSFGLCIANFVIIFFNMLLATRYAINTRYVCVCIEWLVSVDGSRFRKGQCLILSFVPFHPIALLSFHMLACLLAGWMDSFWSAALWPSASCSTQKVCSVHHRRRHSTP